MDVIAACPEAVADAGENAIHVPVMAEEVIRYAKLTGGESILDGTGGFGGHARRLWERAQPGGKILVLDQDPAAIEALRVIRKELGASFMVMQSNFRNLDERLEETGFGPLDVCLLDLGVSSLQLDDPRRGFSFRLSGSFDMRMNPGEGMPASEAVRRLSERELAQVIRSYGEERFAGRIARALKEASRDHKIEDSLNAASVIEKSVPGFYRHGRIHPATRTFQALRIYVNGELDALSEGLEKAFEALKAGGRFIVISFHSLEDRIVKRFFKEKQTQKEARLVVKKPLVPGADECERNPRSRSAKMRVLEKEAV